MVTPFTLQQQIAPTQPPVSAHKGGIVYNWINGAGTALVLTPATWFSLSAMGSFGVVAGSISDVTKELIHNFASSWGSIVDPMAVVDSSNPLDFLAEQINKQSDLRISASVLKRDLFVSSCLTGPIIDELIFRGLVQGPVLRGIFRAMGKKELGEGASGMILRTFIAAGLFAIYSNSMSGSYYPNGLMRWPMASNVALGLMAGIVKEVGHGFPGAIGLHMAHNVIMLSPVLAS